MNKLFNNIGKSAFYKIHELEFLVEITDAREVFGRIDYRIKPISGKGEKWVSSESIKEVK